MDRERDARRGTLRIAAFPLPSSELAVRDVPAHLSPRASAAVGEEEDSLRGDSGIAALTAD